MTAFADSSAIVKRYADEDGADRVRAHPLLVVSALARVEVAAAVWRKHRMDQLSAEHANVLALAFAADWRDPEGPYAAVATRAELLEEAVRLVAAHGLRGYDAVQLASAVAAREADADIDLFLCFDDQLRTAAARLGFRV